MSVHVPRPVVDDNLENYFADISFVICSFATENAHESIICLVRVVESSCVMRYNLKVALTLCRRPKQSARYDSNQFLETVSVNIVELTTSLRYVYSKFNSNFVAVHPNQTIIPTIKLIPGNVCKTIESKSVLEVFFLT